MAAGPIHLDLSKAEPVDERKADPDPARVQLVITDGGKRVVLRLELNVTGVSRIGNNPMTGGPIYNIQSTNVLKTLQWDCSLKAPPKAASAPEGVAHR